MRGKLQSLAAPELVKDPVLSEDLSPLITGRVTPLFQRDLEARRRELESRIGGARVLVIGGAGSVGSATLREIGAFQPRALHVVDLNENSLARLVRDLRATHPPIAVADFRALPLDFGSQIMRRFLAEVGPYDLVLNFAALKHVRSEKDVYSVLQMLDTNVRKVARLLSWVDHWKASWRYFCVSTDKAANPSSLMGASKRMMEHLVFSRAHAPVIRSAEEGGRQTTSTRFANVAFSDGSLLESFLIRIQKAQPLAAPRNAKRYFITGEEAGRLCLLAAVCGPAGHLLIPRMDPARDLRELESVAAAVLRYYSLDPVIYEDEIEAKVNLSSDLRSGRYPLVLTDLDTSGEKPYEEFVARDETSTDFGMIDLLAVVPMPPLPGRVEEFLDTLESWIVDSQRRTTKEEVLAEMAKVLSQFRHVETGKRLDERL